MIVIVGLGSIGKRHIRNLINLNIAVGIVTKNSEVPIEFINIPIFKCLAEILIKKNEIFGLIICTPTYLHLENLLFCIHNSIPCLLEKPVSHNYLGVEDAARLIETKNSKVMVGFNFRYHSQLLKIKKLITNNYLGKIYYSNLWWCDDITSWYPNDRYLTNYSSSKAMGGGALLTISHEIDLALWLFGMPLNVFGTCLKICNNNMSDVEDFFSGNISFSNNSFCNITVDFISKLPRRGLFINCEFGTITWDYFNGILNIFDIRLNLNELNDIGKISQVYKNSLYIDEIKDFLLYIDDNKANPIPFADGVNVQLLIEKFKISSEIGKVVQFN